MALATPLAVIALSQLTVCAIAGYFQMNEAHDGQSPKQLMRRAVTDNNIAVAPAALTSELDCNTGLDAHPGTPRIAGFSVKLRSMDPKIAALGDRLVKAADASDAVRSCGSFFAYGDYTWCNKAMPAESEFGRKNLFSGFICNVPDGAASALEQGTSAGVETAHRRELNNGQFEALSFGIEETDPWSELMSSNYFLHTRLFDCYIQSNKGPMFNDMHGNKSRENQCTGRGCYSVGYETNRICVDGTAKEEGGRHFLTLSDTLRGRQPLSTHVKMDVEGSEWSVLESLIKNDEDIDRIRTLDMELHMLYNLGDHDRSSALERRVEVMETLAKKFAVAGSTIQPLFRSHHEEFERDQKKNPLYLKKPSDIYTSAGLPLDQYCISFVNRKLL